MIKLRVDLNFRTIEMIKNLIAPLQKILLQKKLCPACTSDLTKLQDRKPKRADTELVTCVCGRIFVYDKDLEVYRRALEEEVNSQRSQV